MRYLVLATLAISALLTGVPAGAKSALDGLDAVDLTPEGTSQPPSARAPREVQVDPAILDSWMDDVRGIVSENLNFPLIARLQHDAKSSGIRLLIDRNGKIESATVENSSGNEDVDEVTRQMFERMTFPPLPENYPYEKLTFVYTINYIFH